MTAEIVTLGFCPQYFSDFQVPGSSGQVYRVTLAGGEGPAICTCPAYIYHKGALYDRTCKHIKLVWDHGCLWNPQWKDAGPNDLEDHDIKITSCHAHSRWEDQKCEGCGEPVVPVRCAV